MEGIRELVRQAHEEHRVLRIAYRKTKKQEAIPRDIRVYAYGEWYVEAHCLLRDDNRRFRIDRIEHAELLDETFTPVRYFSEHARRKGWQHKKPSWVDTEPVAGSVEEPGTLSSVKDPEEISDPPEETEEQAPPMRRMLGYPESRYEPVCPSTYASPPPRPLEKPAKSPKRGTWRSRVLFAVVGAILIAPIVYHLCFRISFLDCDFCSGVSYLTNWETVDDVRKRDPQEKPIWLCSRCKGHGTIPLSVRFLAGAPEDNLTPDRLPIPDEIAEFVLERRMSGL